MQLGIGHLYAVLNVSDNLHSVEETAARTFGTGVRVHVRRQAARAREPLGADSALMHL